MEIIVLEIESHLEDFMCELAWVILFHHLNTCFKSIYLFQGHPPPVAQSSPQPSPQPQQQAQPEEDKQDDSKFKMFVGGLGLLTEEQLKEYFSKIGEIDNVILLRGFGFVTFKSPGSVDQVIQDAKVINGKTMHCINGKYVECKRTHAKVRELVLFFPLPTFL